MEVADKTEIFHQFLGEFLRDHREEKGISLDQATTGCESGLSKNSLSLIEKGQQKINAFQLMELSEHLAFSISDAFEYANLATKRNQYPELKEVL